MALVTATGLTRDYPQGTPVCRVDVLSFSVDTASDRLVLDRHDGNGPQMLLEGIRDLQIEEQVSGSVYRLTLTARSPKPLPGTGEYLVREFSSVVKRPGG